MSERLAYVYDALSSLSGQAEERAKASKKVARKLSSFSKEINAYLGTVVALEGDFYVDSGEALREKISDVFGKVVRFPGGPTKSQILLTDQLEAQMAEVDKKFEEFTGSKLGSMNGLLEKNQLSGLNIASFDAFLGE